MTLERELPGALRRYWGYDSFRPYQERIVRSLLDGRDTCVIMPTGGGKSLCYQLPAAMQPQRTVIVISPLIALMHDQVAQLRQMGIEAALLNSSIPANEQSQIMKKAREGAYRLLYLSPERLSRADTIEWLRKVPVSFFAIDEAHCISEWGHEFRPEYRQLNRLRAHFPDCPIAAFTASATRRVRHDIIDQLRLRDPHKYIASFHRPNLRYFARHCEDEFTQMESLARALRAYPEGNIIVYSPTIDRVGATITFLDERGIPAIGYHGRMDSETRKKNQERWMSDEIRVLVGTLAFGLGINKAAVRAVIHLSLTKSLEQYYQEAGRAGRDGRPADCVLLWQKRDAGLLAHFIGQISDPMEKERAWQRYHDVRRYADSNACRHRMICSYFGENPKWASCGACDVCGASPKWLWADPEITERPRRRKKKKSTPLPAPSPIARDSVPELRKPVLAQADPELLGFMREWRRTTAQERGIAAFLIMHDTSLEELCRIRPHSLSEIFLVTGFGERKIELYGQEILDAFARFEKGVRATPTASAKSKPAEETMQLLARGRSFEEIAQIRGRRMSTVIALVADMVEHGDLQFRSVWIETEKQKKILEACGRNGIDRLGLIKKDLPEEITYDEIRLVVAELRRQENLRSNL